MYKKILLTGKQNSTNWFNRVDSAACTARIIPYPNESSMNPFILKSFFRDVQYFLNDCVFFVLSSSCASLGGKGGNCGKSESNDKVFTFNIQFQNVSTENMLQLCPCTKLMKEKYQIPNVHFICQHNSIFSLFYSYSFLLELTYRRFTHFKHNCKQ